MLWDKSQAHLEELMKSEKPRQSLRPKDPRHILELNAHEVSYRLLAEFGVEISDVRFATQSGQAHLRRSGSYIQSGAGGPEDGARACVGSTRARTSRTSTCELANAATRIEV